MNRYISAICMIALTTSFLTGCGQAKVPEEIAETSLTISNKGNVTSYLVDVFDKDYYNISDLTAMAIEEAADYNTKHQQGESVPVTVEKVEAKADGSGKVVVTHRYDSVDSYADFNEAYLYFGLADQEELQKHFIHPLSLKSVKNDTLITEQEWEKALGKNHMIITDAKAVIYCPYGVTYTSEGAVCREDGTVDTSNAEGTVVILMKK